MKLKLYEPTLAFAGLFQAATLVHTLAQSGTVDKTAFATSIKSIYKTDAKNIESIFDGVSHLRLGITQLIETLDKYNPNPDVAISTYVISFIHLQKKLRHSPETLATLHPLITSATIKAEALSPTHPQMLNALANLYLQILAPLHFQIKITGHSTYLNNPEITDKIRALLLAGLRAAVLWEQVGGTRWQLLFSRGKMVKTAREILVTIQPTQSRERQRASSDQ